MKIRLLGAELFYADGQADRHDETNSRFLMLNMFVFISRMVHHFISKLDAC